MQEVILKYGEQDYATKEAFKTLRTNIEFSGDDIKAICLTSCTPSEGKSNTSFGLARAYAENGKKTLLIDADLRKSVMRARHDKGRVRYGLTNCLAGRAQVEDAICSTDTPNFHMIFSGPTPPNPSELLGNNRFMKLMNSVKEDYDMVVVDTPPLGSVIDAAVVSKCCDGVIMVIESGAISHHFAKRVRGQLELTGCKILGCVLNKVDLTSSGYYGKYYGKYYGSYGDDNKEIDS